MKIIPRKIGSVKVFSNFFGGGTNIFIALDFSENYFNNTIRPKFFYHTCVEFHLIDQP